MSLWTFSVHIVRLLQREERLELLHINPKVCMGLQMFAVMGARSTCCERLPWLHSATLKHS